MPKVTTHRPTRLRTDADATLTTTDSSWGSSASHRAVGALSRRQVDAIVGVSWQLAVLHISEQAVDSWQSSALFRPMCSHL